MSPGMLRDLIHWHPPLLAEDEPVAAAVERVLESRLPALPVVNAAGKFAGIFGEREFITALFPGYLGELHSARFVPESIDELLDRRSECAREPVGKYANRERIAVTTTPSEAEIAETFLHHRVLIVPLVDHDRPVGLVTRSAFFRAAAERFLGRPQVTAQDDGEHPS